ncbi:MAG: hypothetical protein IJZ35_07570 [Clostridia bacterium]|nr:hypothetical protein [Clostridia bacterium]
MVGFVLFAAVQWYSFSAKRILWAQMQNTEKIKTSVALVLKLIAVRFSVIAVKTVTFILSLLPSAFLFTVLYANLKNGMSDAVALVFLVGSVMLFIAGLSFALIVNQRYYLAEYCLFSGGSVKDVLLHSIYLMDFKCRKLLKCKLKHLPFKIFGIFVPQLSVIADAREFLLVTDKTIEYARKAHTQQKTVVFYCNKTTA